MTQKHTNKKSNTVEFIGKAIAKHGDKYDYSGVEYSNNKTKVKIRCKKHNYTFEVRPDVHLHNTGCPICRYEKRLRGTYGIGVCDVEGVMGLKSYLIWNHMIKRCYQPKQLRKNPTYTNVEVCKEWLLFSNFKRWFDENYVDGCQIDKDLLSKDAKIYSPDTCVFLPSEINSALISNQRRSKNPHPGVKRYKDRFQVNISVKNERVYCGTFYDLAKAIEAYATAKTEHIHQLAEEYYAKGQLSQKAYHALMEYNYADRYNITSASRRN